MIVLFVLLSLCAASLAQRKASAVTGDGTASDFWIAQTFVDSDGTPLTSLRQRTDAATGAWTEIATLQDRVLSMSAAGNRLAVVTSDGWRLLWQGGSYIGASLPGERVISRMAGDGDAVWALAGPAAGQTPELFRWDQNTGWVLHGTLPEAAGAGAGSLAVRDGVPWIAYLAGKNVCVDRAEATGWKRVAALPLSTTFKLLAAGPSPLLAWRDVSGKWTIYDVSASPAKVIQIVDSSGPSDVAIAGTSLRVLSMVDDKKVVQLGFDDFGRGPAFGPDVIAQVAPAMNQANEWPNFFMMGLVTAALVVGMRTRTPPSVEALAAARVRVAPVGRRLAAGVIDAIPYIAGTIYVSRRLASEAIDASEAPQILLVPIFAGLAVYVLHVAISEYFFGRSLGKMLFGLRVVSSDGTPAEHGPIVLRNVLRLVDMSLALPVMLILIYATGQRFGDMAARTLVVTDVRGEKTV